MVSRKIVLALGFYVGSFGPAWGQNHSLRSDHLVINTQSHWSNWGFVKGTLDISLSGEVVPAFVPKNNNVVLDIVEHLQRTAENSADVTILDAIVAGSNKAAVANLTLTLAGAQMMDLGDRGIRRVPYVACQSAHPSLRRPSGRAALRRAFAIQKDD